MPVQPQHVQQIRQTNFLMVPNRSGQQQAMLQLIRETDGQQKQEQNQQNFRVLDYEQPAQRPDNIFNLPLPIMATNNDDGDLPPDV